MPEPAYPDCTCGQEMLRNPLRHECTCPVFKLAARRTLDDPRQRHADDDRGRHGDTGRFKYLKGRE